MNPLLTPQQCRNYMQRQHMAVVIPTYNHGKTLLNVVERTLPFCNQVVVVDDGSTDETPRILQQLAERVLCITHEENLGKGAALQTAFNKLRQMQVQYAVTLDSDAQHFPEDLPKMLLAHAQTPDALIVGMRSLNAQNMPAGNSFANKFSNFWFRVQTFETLHDTQSGYRIYPLSRLPHIPAIHRRYTYELAVLVYSAWKGVPLAEQPIRVYYAPVGERVSHFKPFADFLRISLLNTWLCFQAFSFRLAVKLIRKYCS